MSNEITFHQDMYEKPHAAVNVKLYTAFRKVDTLRPFFERIGMDEDEFNNHAEMTLEGLKEVFWAEDVQDIGKDWGFEKVYSEGRMSGWAAPYPYLYEEDFEEDTVLVDRFLSFKEKLNEICDGADAFLFSILKDDFDEMEKEWLREHSVTVRSIMAWRKYERVS